MGWNLDAYEPVENRIKAFYDDHRLGRIITEVVSRTDRDWVVKASVFRKEKDTEPAATGFAQEVVGSTQVNRTSALENCETSAIGRALANLGYHAKGGRPSREEMEKVARDSEGVSDVGAQQPSQAAPVPGAPSDQPQQQREGSENRGLAGEGEAPAVAAAPPVADGDWATVLETIGASSVLQVAQEVAKEMELKPPFTKRALNDMPPEVFHKVVERIGEKERVA